MSTRTSKSRLEAFCDGVFAIALTLLIIDIKIPSDQPIHSNAEFWLAVKHVLPSVYSFLLSFGTILITWVNHHAHLRLIDKISTHFIYANGFLLLAIVILPFPTSLLGEHLLTDHAAPAVVLYSSVTGLQSVGWILMGHAALKPVSLGVNEMATKQIRKNMMSGYYALGVYTVCTGIAFWFPLTIAIVISLIWILWMIYGLRIKVE